jgi:hypothetical protein
MRANFAWLAMPSASGGGCSSGNPAHLAYRAAHPTSRATLRGGCVGRVEKECGGRRHDHRTLLLVWGRPPGERATGEKGPGFGELV